MKKIFTVLFVIAYFSTALAQLLSSTNSGAVSNQNLIYSVGEVFVTPTNSNDTGSGLIGAYTKIEFTSLAVNEITTNPQIKVYPNPTTDAVFIQFNNERISEIHIFDVSGKLVKTQKNLNNKIDLSDLQTGTYFIKTDNIKIKPFKIIKH